MADFSKTRFKWTFRSYQQSVLDNSARYLADKKIHIVAAPGSGKTILGLELIRRIGRPALVFSPSVTIRQQWGERFYEAFVDENDKTEYVSGSLFAPALITSVTYQALHAAMTRQTNAVEEDEVSGDTTADYSQFDLYAFMREQNIGTICLDEAHHLRSEWQKALEEFIKNVCNDVTVISLTATPPYDSTPAQWKRYTDICGETDEEIYVPQLVAQNSLCPHQDFVIFNHPDKITSAAIEERIKNASTDEEYLKETEALITDTGKLESIYNIVENEVHSLGSGLRMLILTDYIRKEFLPLIGTAKEINSLGTVPVFECARRAAGLQMSVALLSGTLVIINSSLCVQMTEIAQASGAKCSFREITGTLFCEAVISGSNKNKVSIITKMFEQGLINILVGTKSLLGEGWDSPSINSLVMASFVGSYMLSNQMRGRAIRTCKQDPGKVSCIWHLVTVLPKKEEYGEASLGADYLSLKRRFGGFIAPAFDLSGIESGLDRIGAELDSYRDTGIDKINRAMYAAAADRASVAASWKATLGGCETPEVTDAAVVPPEAVPKFSTTVNFIIGIIAAFLAVLLIVTGLHGIIKAFFKLAFILAFAVTAALNFIKIKKCGDPVYRLQKTADSLYKTLVAAKILPQGQSRVQVMKNEKKNALLCCIGSAGVHEKALFAKAAGELLSRIENPRYIFVKGGSSAGAENSFACPSVLGTKKENAEMFAKALKPYLGELTPVYTSSDRGEKLLNECRRKNMRNIQKIKARQKKIALVK